MPKDKFVHPGFGSEGVARTEGLKQQFLRKGRGKRMFYDNHLYVAGISIKEDAKNRMFILLSESDNLDSVIKTLSEKYEFYTGMDNLGVILTSYYNGDFYNDYDLSFIGKLPLTERNKLDEFIEHRDETYRNLDRFDDVIYEIISY